MIHFYKKIIRSNDDLPISEKITNDGKNVIERPFTEFLFDGEVLYRYYYDSKENAQKYAEEFISKHCLDTIMIDFA